MPCLPCEERKARLKAMAEQGENLPVKDWAFYGVVLVAVLATGYIAYSKRKGKEQ